MNQPNAFPNTVIWEQHIPGGCHWSGIVRRGTTLRLADVAGGANAAVLFFNQEEKLERYNMADTLKSQHTFRLTKGHACHSDMGRIFCCITADTVGWHDTVCGLSDAELIRRKYGVARYQEHRNQMFRSGLDGMLIELGKWGLGMRDVVSNINFFSKVDRQRIRRVDVPYRQQQGRRSRGPGFRDGYAGGIVRSAASSRSRAGLPAWRSQSGCLCKPFSSVSLIRGVHAYPRKRTRAGKYPTFICLSWR